MQRNDLWITWRAIEPDVEPSSRVTALRRRLLELWLRDERPDVPLRRWWTV
jgi:hypothetical protein